MNWVLVIFQLSKIVFRLCLLGLVFQKYCRLRRRIFKLFLKHTIGIFKGADEIFDHIVLEYAVKQRKNHLEKVVVLPRILPVDLQLQGSCSKSTDDYKVMSNIFILYFRLNNSLLIGRRPCELWTYLTEETMHTISVENF